ncbi:MAG: phenylalanine--tRNA ligase subunit beta [Cyanobacteria bacterium P01_D01_bin.123]
MKISLNWLRELVDFDLDPEALGEALTLAGFEVEDIEDRRAWANGVVVGHILEAERHPNADRLQVCQVDVGQEQPSNIVCGAANARKGLYVAVALPGTYLPAIDLKLKRMKMRGVQSEGMICSLSELNLAKTSEGIYEFAGEPEIGADVRPLLGLDEVILDLTSTANRADALSMVGIAREVAALTRNEVVLPFAEPLAPERDAEVKLDVADENACPAYSGSLIRGVEMGPSPEWMQRRVEAAGMRPINLVVDITNYVLLEWGQPLHAFDWQKLQDVTDGDVSIGVRLAKQKETLKTLDGSDRALKPDNLLITAGDRPVALAGVMGGEDTEVDDSSTDIFLEAALFDPVAVRRSARAQTLRTEASARYERGVDFSAWLTARDRAIALILELAGGELIEHAEFDARPQSDRSITLRWQRLVDVMGEEVSSSEVEDTLEALGFQLAEVDPGSSNGTVKAETETTAVWKVRVPPYRMRDIEREIDLIEEFARLYGYDRFPETLPVETEVGDVSTRERFLRQVRSILRGAGLTELMHISLCPQATGVPVVISNPLAEEFSALRQELLPNLIDSFAFNWDRGNGPLAGFEIGRVFWRNGEGYQEADRIGGILGGNSTRNDWQKQSHALDWYEAKGILEGIFQLLGLTVAYRTDDSHESLHPGRTASLWVNDDALGLFGQLHPRVCRDLDLPNEVYVFELKLDVMMAAIEKLGLATYQAFSTFPVSDRDIAFFCPITVSVGELNAAIARAAGNLLEDVQLFDDYRGEGVPEGQRSLAFRLIYRASDRTLTEAEVESAHQNVREQLQKQFAVELRS